jgi:serine/threonine protein kinase
LIKMNETQECLSEDILRQFNSGKLNDLLLEERIADHLAACRKCETRLAAIPRDSMAQLLAEPNPLESFYGRQGCPIDPSLTSTLSFGGVESQRASQDAVSARTFTEQVPVTIDRYFVIRELGSGGFSRVYLAHDPQYNRAVAIKLPRHDRLTTAEARRAFLAEARMVAQLVHPHIVPLYDCRELPDGRCMVVMQYIEGSTLREVMSTERLPRRRSLKLIAEIAEALDYAHRQGVWHRDVKPANILVDRNGHPFLSDFGLAIREERQYLHHRELAGTLPYMSPEQIGRGAAHLDGRSDIWSLGIVMYELLTRHRPFRCVSTEQLEEEIERRPHRPLSSHDATIPPRLEAILDRCLKKSADGRYATAGRLAADIRKYLSWPRVTAMWLTGGAAAFLVIVVLIASLTSIPVIDLDKGDTTLAKANLLVWSPRNDLTDRYEYDSQRQSFGLDTLGQSLLRVGTCHHDEFVMKTRFQIGGAQALGRAGVFWAWGHVGGDERIAFSCWAVNVGRAHELEPFGVAIEQLDIGPSGGRHEVLDTMKVFMVQSI